MKKLSGKWVVGVSGGADSMALLSKCHELKMDIVVAHVNYHKRKSSSRDEEGVFSYCKLKGIPFYKLDVREYTKENFQAQARTIRYLFFNELAHRYTCDGALVAHHLDDVIETFLMQKERKNIPAYYGLNAEVSINGLRVRRPLLNETKLDLIQYCKQYNVSYFEDESNATDDYTRNKVRHQQVEGMSNNQKREIVKEIEQMNQIRKEMNERVQIQYDQLSKPFIREAVNCLDSAIKLDFLRLWIREETSIVEVSHKQLMELSSYLKKSKTWVFELQDDFVIEHEYGMLTIYKKQNQSYTYQLDELTFFNEQFVSVKEEGEKIEGIYVKDEDFPLVIRNYQEGDQIKLRYGTKRVSRFLIDRKIPRRERCIWPVVVNNMGEIIFVCGIGCDIEHYSNNLNMFVVK